MVYIYIWLVGGFNPSEQYESQLGWLFSIFGNRKNPNHQSVYIGYIHRFMNITRWFLNGWWTLQLIHWWFMNTRGSSLLDISVMGLSMDISILMEVGWSIIHIGFTTLPCLTRFLHPRCMFTFSQNAKQDYSWWVPPTHGWRYSQ